MILHFQCMSFVAAIFLILFSKALSDTSPVCSVIQGLPGLNGRDGRDGVNGLKGDPGPPGAQGTPGIRGGNGPPGKVGPSGSPGDKGTPGLKGDKGATGNIGAPDPVLATKVTDLENKIAALEKSLSSLQKVAYFQSGVVTSGNKIYVPNGLEGNYDTTLATCRGAQGTLPTPLNRFENDALQQLVKARGKMIFLGMNDENVEGSFVYLNGNHISYKNWYQKEPNGGRGENCVQMYENGQWIDITCNQRNLIVCEF
ncbi:pulmonary surfactant-associated protein D-like [Pseudophryne corroboree]|uniref:pulmonary surfactant-associated protein D-like n=1 Tax=Pseudophryne corroboree TaxID=495146 RepID=UPI00308136F1